jgi:hypothetical protein
MTPNYTDGIKSIVDLLITKRRLIGWNCIPEALYRKELDKMVNDYLFVKLWLERLKNEEIK